MILKQTNMQKLKTNAETIANCAYRNQLVTGLRLLAHGGGGSTYNVR